MKRMRKMIISLIVLGLIFMSIIAVMIYRVRSYGSKYIMTAGELSGDFDAIIVLGAGVRSDGSPSDILVDRLKTSLEVHKSLGGSKFLLTGDHGRKNYNEVRAMKNFVKQHQIDEANIFMDHAGFNTYDSMYRARDIFEVKRAVVVTNRYHLPRALYIARKLGIEAYGIPSDLRNYYYMSSYKKRELLAQVKAFVNINFLKPLPAYLGESIPVSTSDGRVTDDEL
jgi:SanA protein